MVWKIRFAGRRACKIVGYCVSVIVCRLLPVSQFLPLVIVPPPRYLFLYETVTPLQAVSSCKTESHYFTIVALCQTPRENFGFHACFMRFYPPLLADSHREHPLQSPQPFLHYTKIPDSVSYSSRHHFNNYYHNIQNVYGHELGSEQFKKRSFNKTKFQAINNTQCRSLRTHPTGRRGLQSSLREASEDLGGAEL